MNFLFTCICAVLFCSVYAQINDDFSSSLKNWQGDTAKFIVNANGQLQSNSTTANSSWICRPYTLQGDYTFHLWLNLAFSPSTSNLLKVYIYADHHQIDSIKNGVYFKVGKTGSTDSYDFYVQRKGKTDSLLAAAPAGWAGAANNKANIKLIPLDQKWILQIAPLGDAVFEVVDTFPQFFSGAGYFGIYCKYTSSNGKKFFFDDLIFSKPLPPPPVYFAKFGDIVFTEIMADPDPVIALPNQEYLELYNQSSQSINLKAWTISVNNATYTFPEVLLPSKQHYVLYNPPTLLNEGAVVSLFSPQNELIHSVSYLKKWYENVFKEEGGWSLEMIDYSLACLGKSNWKASESLSGGTPGKTNSVAQTTKDQNPPQLLFLSTKNKELTLTFNEGIVYQKQISIDPKTNIDSVFYTKHPQQELKIVFATPLLKNRKYTAQISVLDCAQNAFVSSAVTFGLADSAVQNDLVFNELLFNPIDEGADFVEVYNRSNKIINTHDLRFSSRNNNGFMSQGTLVGEHPLLLFPNEYAVFTSDKNNVEERYFTKDAKQIFTSPALPALNNDAGNILLIQPNGTIIDEIQYTEKMHHALLENTDGVSLERINPELTQWHSAAQTVGWGTPGVKNSQFTETVESENEFYLNEKTFTPNNDGNKDLLLINYTLNKPGHKLNLTVYDVSGMLVKNIASNFFLSTKGEFQWNGSNENNELLPAGIYIIFAEYFHVDGEVIQWKESVVLQR